jgi:hypothetical protein
MGGKVREIHHALVLELHQPSGNLEYLLATDEWEAKQILFAYDRIPRVLWQHEDLARVNLIISGTLLETLSKPDFQRRVYGIVDCGALLWSLQNTRLFEVLGTGYYHPLLPLIPEADWDEQISRWLAIARHLFWRPQFQGFWPPDMAFDMRLIPHLKRAGYRYVLVDSEYVRPIDAMSWQEIRYRPHIAEYGGEQIIVVVRDREISAAQLAGMDYDWFHKELIDRTKDCNFPPLVTTATAGENGGWFRNVDEEANFWTYFYREALNKIRTGLSPMRPTFISDYLDRFGAHGRVSVESGAWDSGQHHGWDYTQWQGSQAQRDTMARLHDVSREFHRLADDVAGATSPSERRHLLSEAQWRLLRAETSCNFFWGDAWLYKVHKDLDDAEWYLGELRGKLGSASAIEEKLPAPVVAPVSVPDERKTMATELKRFTEAYATMTIAAYEPLILRWVSRVGIRFISNEIAKRFPKASAARIDGSIPMGLTLSQNVGRLQQPSVASDSTAIPLTIMRRLGRQKADLNFISTRDEIQHKLFTAAQEWVGDPDNKNLFQLMTAATNVTGVIVPHLWPGIADIQEALSPIGIAHYFRQLYFNKEEGVGPIEEAFTIAPLETLEVVYQTIRKQIHEEILEQGLEVVSDSAVEEKNLDEVSDKVSSMVQQDVSASMSASASGGIGVWQVGASATANFGVSSQRSREYATRRLKETTKRASERITKSFSIRTRDVTEVTTTNLTRRVIRNESSVPVSYGLRRVLRRVTVKVQDLGPRLVWQVYLRNPGEGLARSRFVHFREAAQISVPDIPPGVPPRPSGGVESESTSTSIKFPDSNLPVPYVTIVIRPGADRDITGVRIDNITDLEGGGKDDLAPAPRNEYNFGSRWDETARTYTANIGIILGDSASVQLTYTYTWVPSNAVMNAWEDQRRAAANKFTEEALTAKFEQNRQLITERSKIKSRPANDLRREERYEVMNRMISYLFGRWDDPSEPTPL